ncbi:MAG TPA: ABC transporter substrate-binding protein [Caulobacteraceae bacterium]
MAAGAGAAVLVLSGAAAAGPRVVSLDQCADQFVLALAPRGDIAGLSYRARQPDSYLRAAAYGLPLRRADLESVLAVRPAVVVHEWGGDAQMVRRLASLGVTVVGIDDAADFDGVRANIRRVAAALWRGPQGEALIAGMDAKLAAARGAGRGRRLLYLTSGGFTAGRGTLVAAMMRAAGYANAASAPGFQPVSLERLALNPPDAVALGFFDPASVRTQHWSLASSPVLNRTLRGRVVASLPGDILGCPAWFAADGAQRLANAVRADR